MATGRTKPKWTRVYSNGYDLSGFARSIGPLVYTHDEAEMTAPMSDTVKGYLKTWPQVSPGTLNALFDNTATTGIHALLSTAGTYRNLMIPIGIRAAPAAGDPVFMGAFEQEGYQTADEGGALTLTIPFESGWNVTQEIAYTHPWGFLVHANGAETGANTATGIDDNSAGTTTGGYMMYQIFAIAGGAGTATVKIQHASTNSDGSFADLTGATSGAIAYSSAPTSGIVALSNTLTVNRYIRWQLTLASGATGCTFALAFHRALA